MHTDPIEEIRARRRTMFRNKFHGSVEELIDHAMRWARKHPERMIDLRERHHNRELKLY